MYHKIIISIKVLTVATVGLVGFSTAAFSGEEHHEEGHHDEVHHSHAEHEWELGVSVGYANLTTENEEGGNLHLHLLKRLDGDGIEKYFSVGFGAEMIVTTDYEKHYGAMVTFAYHPVEALTLSVSPGFEWAKHEGSSWERKYATHLEAAYAFDVSENYHIGPVIGYSKTSDTEHYTVGIHIGIPL